MNTNFLAIVKQIVFQHGEAILADPRRLKPLVSDLAKDEPKAERIAFGRCIEHGCYHELKRAASADERRRVKAALAPQLQSKTGIDAASCANALDVLEAVIFGAAPQAAFSAAPLATAVAGLTGKVKSLSRKTIVFGIAGGVGALVGSLLGEFFENMQLSTTEGELIIIIATWGAFLGLGISIGLFIVQTVVTRKKPNITQLVRTVLIGLATGAVAGGFAQFIFNYTQKISPVVKAITNALCWGIAGAGVGLGAAFYVPNYPAKRAALAGAGGGTIGGIIYVAMMGSSGLGTIIGVIVLGFAIGLAISFIEEALRQAWLTVIWGRNETATVSLGEKPVAFGPSKEADIYLAGDNDHPIRAAVLIENGKVVMYDNVINQRRELQNGSRVDLGKLSFVVNTKM